MAGSSDDVYPDDPYPDDAALGPRPVSFLVLLAVCIAASLLVGSVFVERIGLAAVDGAPALVEVRELVGVNAERAVQLLRDDGFRVTVVEKQNVSVPPGVVTSQRPLAGERIEVGSTVELTVSAGDDFSIVPDVRGSPKGELDLLLITHGLGLGEVTYVEDEAARDEVVSQSPVPGELVPRGTQVAVVLSSGPPMIEIPDVRNLPEDEARELLREAGFTVITQDRRSSIRRGHAISTEPADEAPRGSRIVLNVSSGPPPTTTTVPASPETSTPGTGDGSTPTTPTTAPSTPGPGGGGPGGGGPGGPGGGGPGGPGGGPGGGGPGRP